MLEVGRAAFQMHRQFGAQGSHVCGVDAAKPLVGAVAKLVGGSGGGKPEIAEAGGKDQSQIDTALQTAPKIVADLLS